MLRTMIPVLTAAALVAPAATQAATLTSDRACYREMQIMRLTVAGFPSGEVVGFTGDGAPLRAAYGSNGQESFLTGDGTIGIQAPYEPGFTTGLLHIVADASVTGPDGDQQTTTAAKDVRLIDGFHAYSQPAAARPNRVVTYVVAGAVELKPVYLHVYRETVVGGRRKRIRRDVLLGTPKGPCGSLRVRMREVGTMPLARHAQYSRTIDMTPHGRSLVDDQHPAANLQPVYSP